jgi:hypothetical protein
MNDFENLADLSNLANKTKYIFKSLIIRLRQRRREQHQPLPMQALACIGRT